jgi:hypothetical protein
LTILVVGICRPFALVALLVSAGLGCSGQSEAALGDEGGEGGGADPGEAPAPVECQVPSDCVPASSTCCDCPSFAVPEASGFGEGCSEVNCGEPSGCPLVEPACVAGRCELVCSPVATERLCASGFAIDGAGCLLDECAQAAPDPVGSCERDLDCVQVPADCCGCARGGADTAVPAEEEDEHIEGLACPSDPACPEVDVCHPDDEPRCVASRCHLVESNQDDGSGQGPSVPCGSPDLEPCPAGFMCVLNHPNAADVTRLGLGSCQVE